MMHRSSNIALACMGALLMCASPVYAASIEPKGDVAAYRTPQVCMMYHFGTKPDTDPLWPPSNNNLVEASDGTIYGASPNGACAKCHGVIFRMTPAGQFSTMYEFDDVDGKSPNGGLAQGPGGMFYGTTFEGGRVEYSYEGQPYTKYTQTGTIFSYAPGSRQISRIWSFRDNWLRRIGKDDPPHTEKEKKDAPASYPVSPPVTNLSGQTMGVTAYAWNNRYGALYSMSGGYGTVENMEGGTKAIKLLSLSPGVTDNNFYGVSALGPTGVDKGSLYGTVFMTSGGPIKILHTFKGTDGASPSNVIQGPDGKLYGTTYGGGMQRGRLGVVYRMNSDGTGFEILHEFDNTGGAQSVAALVWGTDNRLYGSTRWGGSYGHGALFRLDPDGKNYTLLHSFKMYNTGKAPLGNMIQHSDKYFYGTTNVGGKHNSGGIFRLDAGLSNYYYSGFPGSRECCTVGQKKILGWEELNGHVYGSKGMVNTDPIGYIYTKRAGLIDIAHVRDMADLTKYIYEFLMGTPRNKIEPLQLTEGQAHIVKLPPDQDQMLKLAGAIAYVDGWAHELATWENGWLMDRGSKTPDFEYPQDQSSFSPEDLVSNVIGIVIAQRAISENCAMDFDKAVDYQMSFMMSELESQPVSVTRNVLATVEGWVLANNHYGKWFSENVGLEKLWRRNFDVWPWLVPWEQPRYRPGWLTEMLFKPYYNNFTYEMKNPVDGKKGVTLKTMQQETDALRKKWVTMYPGGDRWERPPPGYVPEGPPDGVPGWPEAAK